MTSSTLRPHTPGAVRARGFGWRHSGRKDPALANLDLDIAPGERVLILGASGSGKSTLLAGIAGVLGDEEDGVRAGSMLIDGVSPEAHRGRVGMVLQDPDSQVIAAHVGDDVVFGCENLGVSREEMWDRAAHAVDVVGLGLPFDHPTSALSGGQKQRLALAGVIAMRPGVIVLDEPTANLDPDGVVEVRDAVVRAAEHTGATLIVVEHRTEIWQEHVERVIVLGTRGAIIADGPADEVLATHSEELVEAGVWVPGVELDVQPLSATQSTDSLLVTHDLAIGWPGEERPVRADMNLTLSTGSTVLTGANGAGKSTLALTIGGLLPPVSGEVDASGLVDRGRKRQPHQWRSRELIRRIGFVFQNPEHQFATRTVREELLLGPKVTGMDAAAAEAHAEELLETLGLSALAPANPYTLSGGEKRRLSVASMLTTRPRLLILDEPTFGQDRVTFTALVRHFQSLLEQGVSLLSISHDPVYERFMGEHAWRLS